VYSYCSTGFLVVFILNVSASENCKLWNIECCKLLLYFSVYQHSLHFFGWNLSLSPVASGMDSIDGSIPRRVSIFHEKRYVSGYDPEFPGSRQLFNGSLRFEKENGIGYRTGDIFSDKYGIFHQDMSRSSPTFSTLLKTFSSIQRST
jgi:hypothetical protein